MAMGYGDLRSEQEKEWERRMMGGLLTPETQASVDQYAGMANGGLLGAPEKPQGYWQGGDKFRARDGIAGLLAVLGDAFMMQGGGEGGAIAGLAGQRNHAMALAEKRAAEQAQLQQMIAVGGQNGLTPAQVQAQALGLDIPQPEKPHELQRLAALANDPTQPPEVRQAATRRLEEDPVLTGVNLPSGGQYYGRLSGLQGYMGQAAPSTDLEAEWNNSKPMGGGTGNGAGGFRPY